MNPHIHESDELLLSRLLDGELSATETDQVRRRLEGEPELRRAFERLQRLDTLLVARRGGQPEIDWKHFRSQVMDRVHAETASRRVIRFPRWLPVAGALAAAAAIALVFNLRQESNPPAVVRVDPGGTDTGSEGGSDRDPLTVQFHRPVYASAAPAAAPRISFVRDDNDLAADYRKLDQDREGRASYVASVPRGPDEVVLPRLDSALSF